jgi:hypothetical protein
MTTSIEQMFVAFHCCFKYFCKNLLVSFFLISYFVSSHHLNRYSFLFFDFKILNNSYRKKKGGKKTKDEEEEILCFLLVYFVFCSIHAITK